MLRSLVFFSVLILFASNPTFADVRLANVFGDNMVLQRGEPIQIFGWGDSGNPIEVRLREQSAKTTVGEDGRWQVTLQPISIGDPFELTVVGDHNTVTLKNCLAGEVWICSGQSNMEWRVAQSNDARSEISNANYPLIRHCDVTNLISIRPNEDVKTSGWSICSPETAGSYTAVGYYFARHIHQNLKSEDGAEVPIGLINTTWGGTIVEAWTSQESLANHPDFKERISQIRAMTSKTSEIEAAQKKVDEWDARFRKAISENSENWQATQLDDSDWKTLSAPKHWETQGMDKLDGVAWYRKRVSIPEAWAGKPAELKLAQIDDSDQTYVNGKRVGGMNRYNANRVYKVPADVVTKGEMTIAVRVVDTGGWGGIHGEPSQMVLTQPGQESISLAGKWKFKPSDAIAALGPRPAAMGFNGPNNPTALYNAMVNGLVPITFKGAIWYQGESNARRAYQYRSLFPLMIQDWRSKWNKEFPFYWVQLANFMKPSPEPRESQWAELREAQSMTLSLPRTGEAVIIDIGEANDIHPRNKQDVGKRLALQALAFDYGQDVVFSGPRYTEMAVEGDKIRLTFDHVGGGLVAKGGALKRFSIAGADKTFVWANAELDGSHVIVSAESVKNPVAVRYAWEDNPEGCNLYNKEGLPASPFRTDDWHGITQPKEQ